MALSNAPKEYSSFVKGLITEASPLTFPEDTASDLDNVVLNRDGSVYRRLGLDAEAAATYLTDLTISKANLEADGAFVHAFRWDNVAGDSATRFVVVVYRATIRVYDVSTSATFSAGSVVTIAGGTSYSISPHLLGSTLVSTVSAVATNEHLILVAGNMTPIYLAWDGSEISVNEITLQIRDMFGVNDGLDVDKRPSSNNNRHNYNLLNQGWDKTKIDATVAEATIAAYPSNSDVWFVAKDATTEAYAPAKLANQAFGASAAPKGHVILDLFNQDRSTVCTDAGFTAPTGANAIDVEDHGRPSAITFFAGRVWWAGITSDIQNASYDKVYGAKKNSTIFFSQTVFDISQAGRCYQENDPTSEFAVGIIDTDGGSITIPQIGNILGMEEVQSGLAILADNGVWFLTGASDEGFKPTEFSVKKVTDVGCISRKSIVRVEGVVFYWATAGVYMLQPDKSMTQLQATNITESSIDTFYKDIGEDVAIYAEGIYDPLAREITWLYSDGVGWDGSTLVQRKNKGLVFNILLSAFYTFTISKTELNDVFPIGVLRSPIVIGASTTPVVVDSAGDVVIDAALDTVVAADITVAARGGTGLLYLCAYDDTPYQFFFASFNDDTFYDWSSFDNTTYDSYITTGYELFGDSQRKKMLPYVTVHLLRTEDGVSDVGGTLVPDNQSSCKMQVRWDFTNTTAAGKWGSEQEVYRYVRYYQPVDANDTFNTGYEVITTKNKVRGRGRALSLKFSSSEGKDMKLLGWAVMAQGLQEV